MTTVNESMTDFYGNPIRMCDSCDQIIEDQGHLHWTDKNFDLCYTCLMSLYQKVFQPFKKREEKPIKYKKISIPNNVRWRIWKRDNFVCQYCGVQENLSIDHILPESQGGEMIDTNLVTACKSCNSMKSNRTPEEAGMKLMNDPRI